MSKKIQQLIDETFKEIRNEKYFEKAVEEIENIIEWSIKNKHYTVIHTVSINLLTIRMQNRILKENEMGLLSDMRDDCVKKIIEYQKKSGYESLQDFLKKVQDFMKNDDWKIDEGLSIYIKDYGPEPYDYIIIEIKRGEKLNKSKK